MTTVSAGRRCGLSGVTECDFIDPTDRQPASTRQLHAPGANTRGSDSQHDAWAQIRMPWICL